MLRWPQDLPQAARETVGSAKCFKIGRTHTTIAARLSRAPVRLSGNALFLVTCGSLVLERLGQRLLLSEACGCLVLPGDMKVTEVPDRVGRFIYHVIFFDDRVIKEAVRKVSHIAALAAIMRPAYVELYPLRNIASTRWLASLVTAGRPIPNGVVGALRLLLTEMIVPAYLFLHHGYFAQAQGLCLWMEEHVISSESLWEIAAKYPGGARRFFRAFKVYQDISPSRWLRRRRMGLASVWLKHGIHPLGDVRRALGYLDEKAFRRDYQLELGVGVSDGGSLRNGPWMDKRAFKEIIRPFWLVDETTWQRRQQAAEAAAEAAKTAGGSKVDLPPDSSLGRTRIAVVNLDEQEEWGVSSDNRLQNAAKQFWDLQTSAVMAWFEARQEYHLAIAGRSATPTPTSLLEALCW